jgi:anti-anti-sigma factor
VKKGAKAAAQPVLRIEGELTIYRAAELKQTLLEKVGAHPKLEIDLSGVTEVDTAGVQLLMLAKQTALTAQGEVTLVSHSPAVIDVLELLDLAAYFGDPLVVEQDSKTRH